MAFIGTDTFSGLMPRFDESEIPLNAARRAENVDLTGRNLKTIHTASPFYALHDGTDLVDQIPSGEVKTIPTPGKPGVGVRRMLQDLGLAINGYAFMSYIDISTGEWVVSKETQSATIANVEYTEYGLRIECTLPAIYVEMSGIKIGTRVELTGPLFQFDFTEKDDGPDSSAKFPETANLSPHNNSYPQCMMPYSDSNGVVFGHFQVMRCDHVPFTTTLYKSDVDLGKLYFPENKEKLQATFFVDMNYVVNSRRYYYYVSTYYDSDGREGPPSDISDLCTVRPGEHAKITVSSSTYDKRLYRSVNGQDGFAAVAGGDDVGSPYIDQFHDALGQALPMYGNPPTFDNGNLLHPAQFGVAFEGKNVWFSDVFRLHAWPDEWKVTFETDVLAVQLIGNSVIVFTAGDTGEDNGKVFMMSGSDPRYMSRMEVITTEPLLNKLSLCKIGQSLFYVSTDGLMQVSNNGPQNITASYYTRRQWQELSPEHYSAETADNSIFLTHNNDGTNLRIDLDEKESRISTWTDKTSVAGEWESRVYSFPAPVRFTTARVYATSYPSSPDPQIKLTLHNQETGEDIVNTVEDSNSFRTPRMSKSRLWSYSLDVPNGCEIKHAAVASATIELDVVKQQNG